MAFERPISLKEVEERTGWSRFKILRLRREQGFPDPIKGAGYFWHEIEAWQEKLIAERNELAADDVEKNRAKYEELKIQLHAVSQKLKAARLRVSA